jgi:hypothetical protein
LGRWFLGRLAKSALRSWLSCREAASWVLVTLLSISESLQGHYNEHNPGPKESSENDCQACWDMPVTPALRRLRKEALEFEVSLGYTVKPCLKKASKRQNTVIFINSDQVIATAIRRGIKTYSNQELGCSSLAEEMSTCGRGSIPSSENTQKLSSDTDKNIDCNCVKNANHFYNNG